MIPNFKEMMFPILTHLADGQIHTRRAICDFVADYFKLSAEDRELSVPSKQMFLYENRASWALAYLVLKGSDERMKNALLKRQSLGKYEITELGIEISKTVENFKSWCEKVHGKKISFKFKYPVRA